MTGKPVVLVTGAGSGMGLATALHLAGRGWTVYGSVLNESEAVHQQAQSKAAGVSVETLQMDITDDRQVADGLAEILCREGALQALVNFAGVGLRGFLEDLTIKEIRHAFEVNFFGMVRLVQGVLPAMRAARSGRIVIATSVAGRMGSMTISGYASSKFAMEGLGECLAQEVAPFGIWVSLLEPGLVLTEHFTRDRNRARGAVQRTSPYYAWFCQHEKMVDDILARNRMTPATVAHRVERILDARRPRLRYVVGAKANLVLALRRYLPGELFERAYFGALRRMVTAPRVSTSTLSGELPRSEAGPDTRATEEHE